MFNLDPAKLLVIAIVGIILLGPDKLPQVAKQAGAAWRTLNEFRHRMESEVRNTMPDLPPTSEIARLARSPSALLNHLSTMSTEEDADEVPDGAYKPPGDVASTDGTGTPGVAAGADGAAAASAPAPAPAGAPDSSSAEGAGGVPGVDGAGSPSDAPPAGDPAAATSPGPTIPAFRSPEPEVIAPGDPNLN